MINVEVGRFFFKMKVMQLIKLINGKSKRQTLRLDY